jgi:hypothetical protein
MLHVAGHSDKLPLIQAHLHDVDLRRLEEQDSRERGAKDLEMAELEAL